MGMAKSQDYSWLPSALRERGVPLDNVGVNSTAWFAADALAVVDACVKGGLAILGGDLWLVLQEGGIVTGDANWACEPRRSESSDEYVERSGAEATAFINHIRADGDPRWAFDLVVAQAF